MPKKNSSKRPVESASASSAGEKNSTKDPEKKHFSPRKCMSFVYQSIKRMSSKWTVFGIACVQIISGCGGIATVMCFPSITDVTFVMLNTVWIHVVACVPLVLGGVIGVIASLTRNTRFLRWYFFIAVLASLVSGNLLNTLLRLDCRCNNFYQCEALFSFHRARAWRHGLEYEDLTNPFPPPAEPNKYESQRKIPWKNPPGENNPGSLLDLRQRSPHVHSRASSRLSTAPTRSTPFFESAHRTCTVHSRASLRLRKVLGNGTSHVGVLEQPQITSLGESGHFSKVNQSQASNKSALQVSRAASFIKGRDSKVDQSRASHLSIGMHQLRKTSASGRVWKTENQSLAGDLKPDQAGKRAIAIHEDGALDGLVNDVPSSGFKGTTLTSPTLDVKRRDFKELPKSVDLNKHPRFLYRLQDSTAMWLESEEETCQTKTFTLSSNSTTWAKAKECRTQPLIKKCPPFLAAFLLDCGVRPHCEGLKVTATKATGDESAKEVEWNFEICFMYGALQTTQRIATDPDTIFFERDHLMTLSGNAIESIDFRFYLEEQEKTPRKEWIDQMVQRRNHECVCDVTTQSCMAHTSDRASGSVGFWCFISDSHKEACDHVVPKINMHQDPVSNKLWSKDVCQNWGCRCAFGLGQRVGHAEKANLNAKMRKYADEKGLDEVIIGHKCDKWFNDDTIPWCIVGFDSSCADREPVHLGGNLRVWKSSYPCQRQRISEAEGEVRESCHAIRTGITAFEILRLLAFIPSMIIVYQFLVNRCEDSNSVRGEDNPEAPQFFRRERDSLAVEDGDVLMFSSDESSSGWSDSTGSSSASYHGKSSSGPSKGKNKV